MKDFVTEKEASQKRCPWINTPASVSDPGQFGSPLVVAPQTCLGSECMAWRWSHQDTGPTAEATGFCGQAGLPKYV